MPPFEFFIAGDVIDLDKITLEPDLNSKFGEKILTIFVKNPYNYTRCLFQILAKKLQIKTMFSFLRITHEKIAYFKQLSRSFDLICALNN